jgi:hypothetical protein
MFLRSKKKGKCVYWQIVEQRKRKQVVILNLGTVEHILRDYRHYSDLKAGLMEGNTRVTTKGGV